LYLFSKKLYHYLIKPWTKTMNENREYHRTTKGHIELMIGVGTSMKGGRVYLV
jgi:hypothetical protein